MGSEWSAAWAMALHEYAPDWLARLLQQLGIYMLMTAVGAAVVRFAPRPDDDDRSVVARALRSFAHGQDGGAGKEAMVSKKLDNAEVARAVAMGGPEGEVAGRTTGNFLLCAAGLIGSYLTWGVLQEQLVAHEYATGRFTGSNFLVFSNRITALAVAFAVTSVYDAKRPLRAPLYEFAFVSLSNILSSWCQIESLKFVSFPTQVLAKSSKLIPVMLMGVLLLRKQYKTYEYGVAVAMCAGAAIFLLSRGGGGGGGKSGDKSAGASATSLGGFCLLALYLFFDSFTSQFQGHLFKQYSMSSYQMMLGINLFSSLFTLVAIVQSGELWASLDFMQANPDCMLHTLVYSLSGVVGQLFIFHTIKSLGPLVFTSIMTARQVLSIVLSCLIFGHAIGLEGALGASLVFAAIVYQMRRQNEAK
jgi:adenosine 3'-phospho 5'-phosphosulfate transporter B2